MYAFYLGGLAQGRRRPGHLRGGPGGGERPGPRRRARLVLVIAYTQSSIFVCFVFFLKAVKACALTCSLLDTFR